MDAREEQERRRAARAELENLKLRLVAHPETGEPDYLNFQARCVSAFGSAAGILCRELVYWTGRGKLEDGWIYVSREDMRQRTGQGNREFEKGRAILRGDRPWAGQSHRVLEERRPNRRAPIEYRPILRALAAVLRVEIHAAGDASDEDLEDDAPESPHGAARDAAESESPHGAAESPHGASQSPNGAAESPRTGPLHRVLTEVPSKALSESDDDDSAETAPAPPSLSSSTDEDEEVPLDDFDSPSPGVTGERDGAEQTGASDPLTDDPAPAPEPPRLDPKTDTLYGDALRLTGDPDHPAGRLARRCLAGEDVFEDLLLAVAGGNSVRAEMSRGRVRRALEELEVPA